MAKPIKHILVIRLSAMGDVAMTVPVLRAFCKQYPEVKLTVLTKAVFAPFFRDLKNVDVFPADLRGKHKGIIGLYKLSKELRKLNLDAIADLHNVLRSKILNVFLSGISFKQIDKGRKEKKELISGQIFHQLKTTHERYADVFRNLGIELDLFNPEFPTKAVLSESVLKLIGKKEGKWIGVASFATYESKMYPLEQMNQVVKKLSMDAKVFLFGGGQKEVEILNTWENKPQILSLAGKLSLDEELDVISNLDVMLSMDSGNAHMAAMLGVKTVTIWGVTHPFAGFAPFNQPQDFCLLADRVKFPLIPTSVYGNKYPEGYLNVAGSISADIIIHKVKEQL